MVVVVVEVLVGLVVVFVVVMMAVVYKLLNSTNRQCMNGHLCLSAFYFDLPDGGWGVCSGSYDGGCDSSCNIEIPQQHRSTVHSWNWVVSFAL